MLKSLFSFICCPCRLVVRKRFFLLCILYLGFIIHSGLILIKQESLLLSQQKNLTHKVHHEDWWSKDLQKWVKKLEETSSEIGHIRQQIRILDAALPRERSLRIYGIDESLIQDQENAENWFKKFINEQLQVKLSLAEIESIERIGAKSISLVPRPLRVYLSNGYTTKQIIDAASDNEKLPNGVFIVADKARGWVNTNTHSEQCTNRGVNFFNFSHTLISELPLVC